MDTVNARNPCVEGDLAQATTIITLGPVSSLTQAWSLESERRRHATFQLMDATKCTIRPGSHEASSIDRKVAIKVETIVDDEDLISISGGTTGTGSASLDSRERFTSKATNRLRNAGVVIT